MITEQQLCPVRLDAGKGALVVLDQTRLPGREVYVSLTGAEQVREAICRLQVRGAPAIGIVAAYGYYLAALKSGSTSFTDLRKELAAVKESLHSARPTAVNLGWALNRMERALESCEGQPPAVIMKKLLDEAASIQQEDEAMGLSIAENGLALLKPGFGILTHCNAGILATSRYGTALAPVYLGHSRGYRFRVFAGETRPLLQGSRLTAWELDRAGVSPTLVCDSMCSYLMQKGWIDACLVGCDRVAANGDTANKIGTSTLAVAAHHYGIPFYVLGPASSFDPGCGTGSSIVIEARDPAEVTDLWYRRRMAPKGIAVLNPAFDVTDHALITAIVTDRGVIWPPYEENIREMVFQ